MDTSNLDERQKKYINLMRDQFLTYKRMSTMRGIVLYGGMGGMSSMGGMGGYVGMGGMSTMGSMRGYESM
jgi:hypothetical protein